MFLATTALSEFWDKDQEILFLGSWCLRYDRRSEWGNFKYQVMPSPWKDRKRFYDAALYLDACGERLLGRLTDYLNAVGVPKDTKNFMGLVIDDPSNLQIFSQVLQGMCHVFPAQSFSSSQENAIRPQRPGWLDLAIRMAKWGERYFVNTLRLISGRRWRIGLCQLEWPRAQIWTLARRSDWRALPFEVTDDWSFKMGAARFDDRRNNLGRLPWSDEFERLFVQSLPWNFPILYLEAFAEAREDAVKKAREFPDVLVSATGWYCNEPFKFMAAEAVGMGCRLVTVQHGGGYGIFRFSAPELHETRLGDTFMVWGWREKETGGGRNLPSPKLSSFVASQPPHAEGSDRMLFVLTAHMRYLLRFHSSSADVADEEYFRWQVRFLEAMPLRLRRFTVVRPYLEDYGHRTRDRLTERFGVLQWDGSKSFLHSLRASRLAVFDHSGTTFLEALRLNVPTILYWDSHLTEVRDEAESYFEGLRKAGILWDLPEAAAAKVEEIYDDPWAWWGSTVVQETRQIFVDRFASGRKDWVGFWVKALEEEMALSQIKEQ